MTILQFIFGLIDLITTLALGFLLFLAAYYLFLTVSVLVLPRRQPPMLAEFPSDAELPEVLVQLPVYNEERCVERILRVAAALDWPKDRLHIQLIDSSTDGTTAIAARVIAELRRGGSEISHIRRNVHDGYKAGALAAGRAIQTADYVAMLDADFRVPTGWLRLGMRVLLADTGLAFVQSRSEFANRAANWLTRAQQLAHDTHWLIEQEGSYRRAEFCRFDGTGAIWRTAAVDDAGGWLSRTICEDLDLSNRTLLRGWRSALLIEPPILAEAVERIDVFARQNRRWFQGELQVTHKQSRDIVSSKISFLRKVELIINRMSVAFLPCITISVTGVALHAFSAVSLPQILRLMVSIFLITASLVPFAVTSVPFVILKRGSLRAYLKAASALPFLYTYLAFSSSTAVLAPILGKSIVFTRTPKTGA